MDTTAGQTQEPQELLEVHALAITPVGFGAQHVTDSSVPFPGGADHGWVVTIGSAVAYVDEATMDRVARAALFGERTHG